MVCYVNFSKPVDPVDFIDRFLTTYKDQTQKIPNEFLIRVHQGLSDGILIDVPQRNLAQFRSSIEVLNESYASDDLVVKIDSFTAFVQHLDVFPARSLVPVFAGKHYTPFGVFKEQITSALFPFELASWYESEEAVNQVVGSLEMDVEEFNNSNEDSKLESDEEDPFTPVNQFSSSLPGLPPKLERQNALFLEPSGSEFCIFCGNQVCLCREVNLQ